MTPAHRCFSIMVTVVSVILGATPPVVADVDDHLTANGWEEMTFDGKAANTFELGKDQVLTVESRNSVSVLRKPITVDVTSTPIMTWDWCLTQRAPATDLTVKGGDDRSLALFVAFPFVPEEATFLEKIERRIVEQRVGPDAPGRVLMYVWGGEGERGDLLKSPYLGDSGRMVILRPAETEAGRWFEERVDIAEDYRRIFGSDAPPVMSIAITADTDDTESQARGLIANLNFVPRTAAF